MGAAAEVVGRVNGVRSGGALVAASSQPPVARRCVAAQARKLQGYRAGLPLLMAAGVCSQELNTTEMLRSLLRKGCEYKHQDACKHLEVATYLLAACLAPLACTIGVARHAGSLDVRAPRAAGVREELSRKSPKSKCARGQGRQAGLTACRHGFETSGRGEGRGPRA